MSASLSPATSADKYPPSIHEEVLDAPATTSTPQRLVAVAVDASEFAEYAFKYCLENVAKPGDQIVLLNVRPLPSLATFGISPYGDSSEWVSKVEESNRAQSHELLKKYGGEVVKSGFLCRAIALRGDAREELVTKVNEINPALLVVGARGLGTFKRTLLGSVSDFAAHHVTCPVLISKKPAK
ncbi:hypothetical protein HK098_007153 [Nowakowskiella sp. JEL0407]|nr:hypothetical protein HK098_007153 [Nowakowskiella sp. JEL0407]